MWALLRFAHSSVFAELSAQGSGGTPLEQVDAEIEARMAMLGDGRLSDMEQRAYESALVWSGTSLVLEDGRVERSELVALTQLVGRERARRALRFAKESGPQAVLHKLRESLARMEAASPATRRRFEEAYGPSPCVSLEMAGTSGRRID